MTTRNIALAINTTTIPQVARLLAEAGITLGPVTSQVGKLRCFTTHQDGFPGVTDDEIRLLHLVAEGLKNAAVARRYGATYEQTKRALRGLYSKLDARNRTDAVAIAYRMGLLDQEAAA